MGACTYSTTWKNCATCAAWEGKRAVTPRGDQVTLDHAAIGVCRGFWQGSRKYPNDNCSQWTLWSAFKTPSPQQGAAS